MSQFLAIAASLLMSDSWYAPSPISIHVVGGTFDPYCPPPPDPSGLVLVFSRWIKYLKKKKDKGWGAVLAHPRFEFVAVAVVPQGTLSSLPSPLEGTLRYFSWAGIQIHT